MKKKSPKKISLDLKSTKFEQNSKKKIPKKITKYEIWTKLSKKNCEVWIKLPKKKYIVIYQQILLPNLLHYSL